MSGSMVDLLDGNTFVVSGTSGDIEADPTDPTGLFSYDTRFLSRWVLTVDGTRLSPLSVDDLQYYETRFYCVPGTKAVYVDAQVSVMRQRKVCDGFREDVLIINHRNEPVEIRLRLDAESDFADLFDVKNNTPKQGTRRNRVEDGQLVLSYERKTFRRETVIRADRDAEIDEHGLTFVAHIKPQQEWVVQLQVTPMILRRGRPEPLVSGWPTGRAERDMAAELQQWLADAPTLQSDCEPLNQTYQRSLIDLAALRFHPGIDVTGRRAMPAAGLPWFMTIFGRDAILTSLQALPFTPDLAATTIGTLGR
jgi:glycogen debranching enzyme